MYGIGVILTGQALKKEYDAYFAQVLRHSIELQPRKGKEKSKYRVAEPLPSKAEYLQLKAKQFTRSVDDLVDDAYSTITELGEEMQEAFDNMPEGLQQGDIGQRREAAAQTLSDFSQPDLPDDTKEITVVFFPSLDTTSRAKRAAEATDMLITAAAAIREYLDDLEEREAEKGEGEATTAEEIDKDGLFDLALALDEEAGNLESVDFPGMYY